MSVHSAEVRFQARNSCGSNSAAVFKSYQKQETIFVNLVACFFVRKDATIKETITREIVSKRR